MSENNEGGAFAAASSGKSPEEIAFELVNKLKGQGVWGERNISAILDMYAECLDAAKGLRSYAGQNRVDMPVKTPGQLQSNPQAPMASARPAAQPPASQQQAPQQSAPPQATAPQLAAPHPTVQAQQQALHQAFKPG